MVFFISACSLIQPYKFEIPQGNDFDQSKLDQLKTGMTPSQVRYLLGSPAIQDPFTENRWDYVYYLTDTERNISKRLITLTFSKGKLASIDERHNVQAK